mmetsp:Transcript_65715/g.122520  ORF Transcript_65715/g.122520 Transcript_65715/m.122520 type:complete len:225 (+) Transcript_65715:146-820(+)
MGNLRLCCCEQSPVVKDVAVGDVSSKLSANGPYIVVEAYNTSYDGSTGTTDEPPDSNVSEPALARLMMDEDPPLDAVPQLDSEESAATFDTQSAQHLKLPKPHVKSSLRQQAASSSSSATRPNFEEAGTDFIADLYLQPGDKLGVALAAVRHGSSVNLQVTGVMADGAVPRWNDANPHLAIRPECLILQVNEHRIGSLWSDEAKSLFRTLPRRMRLVVRRPDDS